MTWLQTQHVQLHLEGSRRHLLCGRGSEREHRHARQVSPRHRLHASMRSWKGDRESAARFLRSSLCSSCQWS